MSERCFYCESGAPLCKCDDCGRPYGDEHGFPDLIIPNETWRRISPNGDETGQLCPSCMCRRLHEAGMRDVPAAFMSGPIRTVSPELMETMRWVENIRERQERRGEVIARVQDSVIALNNDLLRRRSNG